MSGSGRIVGPVDCVGNINFQGALREATRAAAAAIRGDEGSGPTTPESRSINTRHSSARAVGERHRRDLLVQLKVSHAGGQPASCGVLPVLRRGIAQLAAISARRSRR